MLEIAKKALDHAAATGADQAEAFANNTQSTRIRVYRQEVEELASSTGSGVGIRVFRGDTAGFAYTSDLSDSALAATARAASDNAAINAGDRFMGLPRPSESFPELDLYSEKLGATPLAGKIELVKKLEKTALDRDTRISQVDSATYAEGEGEVGIANSLGFSRQFKENTCYAFLQAIAEADGQMQTGMSFTTGRDPDQLEAAACGREAADRALSLLGGAQCESMNCAVVMDPFVASSLIGVIGSVLTGESVQKKRSMFAGLVGQQVANGIFTLTDDGIHPDGLASAPFDGEGVPMGETELIKDGILQGYLYDTYTARKDGCESTGNGIRGSYRSQPHVGATNLRLLGGATPQVEMIASVDKGFYVMEVSGIHSGANPVSGDFSVGASGLLIRDGQLAEPVREVVIAGNLMTILKNINMVGDDKRWVPFGGSIQAPSLLIGEMTVSGK